MCSKKSYTVVTVIERMFIVTPSINRAAEASWGSRWRWAGAKVKYRSVAANEGYGVITVLYAVPRISKLTTSL